MREQKNRKFNKYLLILFLLFFALPSCTNLRQIGNFPQSNTMKTPAASDRSGLEVVEAPEKSYTQESKVGEKEVRYLIKNRTISLEVKEVKVAAGRVEELAKKYGGYVSSQNLSVSYPSPDEPVPLTKAETVAGKDFLQGFVEARVPVDNFDKFSREVKKIGRVLDDVISTQEVTQEYVDLKARLKNLEKQEVQYLKILERSGKIADILAVEKELERVRSEIESLKSQQMILEKSIKMASVRVELKKEQGVIAPPSTGWGFKEAWQQAVRNFVSSINSMIIFSGWVLPYLIALVILYYLLRLATPYLNKLSLKRKKPGAKKGS